MCVQTFVKVLCPARTRLWLCRSFCVAIFSSHEFTRFSHDFHEFRAKTCMTSSSRKIATGNAARLIFVSKKDEEYPWCLAHNVASLESSKTGRNLQQTSAPARRASAPSDFDHFRTKFAKFVKIVLGKGFLEIASGFKTRR